MPSFRGNVKRDSADFRKIRTKNTVFYPFHLQSAPDRSILLFYRKQLREKREYGNTTRKSWFKIRLHHAGRRQRHRTGQRLALPLHGRRQRRRIVRDVLPALSAAARIPGHDHGTGHRTRLAEKSLRGIPRPSGETAQPLALPRRGILFRQSHPDDHVHHRHRLDAHLFRRFSFRLPFRSDRQRRTDRKIHSAAGQSRPDEHLHAAHGVDRIAGLRGGTPERSGTGHQDPDGRTFRAARRAERLRVHAARCGRGHDLLFET